MCLARRLVVPVAMLIVLIIGGVDPAAACSLVETVPLAELGEISVPEGATKVIGIFERTVIQTWPATAEWDAAHAFATTRYWGEMREGDEYSILGGHRTTSPPGTTACPETPPPLKGETTYRALWDSGATTWLADPVLDIDAEALLAESFGPPVAVPVPDLSDTHPSVVASGTSTTDGSVAATSTSLQSAAETGQTERTSSLWLLAIAAIAIIALGIVVWLRRRSVSD